MSWIFETEIVGFFYFCQYVLPCLCLLCISNIELICKFVILISCHRISSTHASPNMAKETWDVFVAKRKLSSNCATIKQSVMPAINKTKKLRYILNRIFIVVWNNIYFLVSDDICSTYAYFPYTSTYVDAFFCWRS